MSARAVRSAPSQAEFNERDIPVETEAVLASEEWHRLYQRKYVNQFHPSPSSRLTPRSMKFPCCYLGASQETAVAEIWGDAIDARRRKIEKSARKRPNIFSIPKRKVDLYAFLQVRGDLPSLRLCDLTDEKTRGRVGIESGTLYTPRIRVTQAWAELIANHAKGQFDGIVYRSRHTEQKCVVLWVRPGGRELKSDIAFERAADFRDSLAAQRLADQMGMRISFLRS